MIRWDNAGKMEWMDKVAFMNIVNIVDKFEGWHLRKSCERA